jgi:cytochrome c553
MQRNLAAGLCLFLLVVSAASSQPSTQLAWTPGQLKFVAKGNAERGQAIAEACDTCHGAAAASAETPFPYLNGQLATYLFRQLRDYKDGSRVNEIMSGLVARESDQWMADIAAWYSRQAPVTPAPTKANLSAAERLVRQGDSQRTIAPCSICHGTDGRGQKIDVPSLAGQKAAYLEQTLLDYKTSERKNDVYQRMRHIARQLRAEEIRTLALYYSSLGD